MGEDLASRFLSAVDSAAPGVVGMLYLSGSVALGDYRPGRSDVDSLIVTTRALTDDDLDTLAAVHAGRPDTPHFDTVYLDPAGLAEQPADERVVPFVVDGEFHTERPCGQLNPVLWVTLERYGVPVRGPAVAELGLRTDRAALRRWNLDNLRTYWQPLAAAGRAALADRPDDATVDAGSVVWSVLGPARLHYTLASGDITSKTRAGGYLAETFPEWATLADRAVRWRAGEPVEFVVADGRAAMASVDAVVTDAWRRWGIAAFSSERT